MRLSSTRTTRSRRPIAFPPSTMVVSVDDIAAAYDDGGREAEEARRLSRLLAILVVLLALVAIALALVWGLMR